MFNSWRHGSCFEAFNELSRDMAVAGRDCYQMIFLFQYICNTEQSLAFCSSLTSFKYCSEVLLELSMLSLKFVLLFSLSKLKCSENSERGGGEGKPLSLFLFPLQPFTCLDHNFVRMVLASYSFMLIYSYALRPQQSG